jgi:hypothetical protein
VTIGDGIEGPRVDGYSFQNDPQYVN